MPSRTTTEQLTEQLRRRDAEIERRDATIAELTQLVHKLSGELEWCKRQLFARRSERYEDPGQPKLFELGQDQDGEQEEPAATITVRRRVPAARGKRRPIPDHLRRERIVHELPEADRLDPVTGAPLLQKIGEEISEKLAFRPGEVYVEQHVRCKYRRVGHENLAGDEPEVVAAPLPAEGLARCLAAPSLLAEIAVRKYADHQPLDRLVRIFRRHDVELSKASMCRWMQEVGELVQPLIGLMKRRMLEHSRVIQHDDTPVRQQHPESRGGKKGKTRTCRFWTAVGQPHTSGHYAIFAYTQSRARAGPEDWFRGSDGEPLFAGGLLQCDAFGGYNGLFDPKGPWTMVHVGCWAHARRKFHDARLSAPGQACDALSMIGELYEVESAARELPAAQRRELRQSEAAPKVNEFFKWCRAGQRTALPKSAIGTAFGYALNIEKPLRRYLDDGELQIDNNACERSLRGIAIGRKNWLFTGSPAGGAAAARLFTVIASARLHGLEPLAYVKDLITRLPATPTSQLEALLPDRWQSQPART